ncbi:MAG: ABC transporter permease [Candidatus Kapaibacterium sp.]|nr:ABC transporter permease [Bacteroidota bacterium]
MNFNKIGVIIRHEFKSRVFTKSFIISLLLLPLGLITVIAVPILTSMNAEDSKDKRIAVVDESKIIAPKLIKEDSTLFISSTLSITELQNRVLQKQLTGFVIVPTDLMKSDTIGLYSAGTVGILTMEKIENTVHKVLRRERLLQLGADTTMLSVVGRQIEIESHKLGEKGVENDESVKLAILGYVLGFFIYMMMFIYGTLVMRAVLEEKTNRIVEVLASSAKPFEILMGKILGVGAVGLLQVVLWMIMSFAVSTFAAPVIQYFQGADTQQQAVTMLEQNNNSMAQIAFNLPSVSPWLILGFFFYFISGYFLYSSLYAAIASAADQEQDIQSLQTPIMIPLILPMLMIGNVITAPDGTLATVLSMIPFFTPTLMIVRCAATTVPMWQIVTSTILVIATFAGTVWAAGRIYRVGILSYGKKASFKDIAKWLVKG